MTDPQYEAMRLDIACMKRENDDLAAKLAAAEARNITLRRLLDTACDAWECGMTVTRPDGVVLADFKAACLPEAWYERAKKEVGDE